MMKTILLVVLVAVLSLVALIVAGVQVRRYLTFRRRVAETTGMKQDLMLWKNLYGLVRGGDGAMEAKATLSSKLGQVKAIFMNGLALIRQAGKRRSQLPWFVLVGEPGSGKTSLYEKSGLEFRTGVSPEMIQGAPLVTWLGPKSYTLDVSGRVFFDRWLKGSGAEWNLLVRSIRRRNRRFPLSGIILTIPADALLTDDATLTREKASIIGNELQRLLKVTGQNLPCHVVVTKLDMLLGFREYFAWLEGQDAAAPFGWQNPLRDSAFDEAAFADWLDTLDGRLREMCFGDYEGRIYKKDRYADENLRLLFEDLEGYVPKGERAESFDQVQARLRDFLEKELETPITILSVGPDRDQTILRNK
mgnify:CR=1 FL=1